MAAKVSIGPVSRPEVTLRTGGVIPSVVARPIGITTPGIGLAQSDTDELLRQLNIGISRFTTAGQEMLKEDREQQFKEGQLAQQKNQEEFAQAVEKGIIPATANPWFIKGYQNQDGRVAGNAYFTELKRAYSESPAKGSDDPEVYKKFITDFNKTYMAKAGEGKSSDWWTGFKTVSDSAQSSMASEHAQEAERAVIAKVEANTGAEVNIILNSTRDPKAAAEAINILATNKRLEGMPSASFEKVVSEAVLAKAKLGDGRMLEALDHIKSGGPDGKGVLSSNPKVSMAKVDVSNFLTEKARGDLRWAWANDDRQWTLQQREIAKKVQEREEQRWAHQQAEWGRAEKGRSILSQIVTSTLNDPANAYANNREKIADLATYNPQAAESATGFIDSFLTRRERVTDAVERPVLAQLQKDMIEAAGNPARQQQLLMDANRLFSEGKLGRDAMLRFIDDASKFASFDPSVQRKLQDPQIVRVRQAAVQAFTEAGSQSVYGSKAIDALVTEQVIDRAVIDTLTAKPTATTEELVQVATKAMQGAINTISPNILGKGRADNLVKGASEANRNLTTAAPQDGNTPPPQPKLSAEEGAKFVDPVDAQAFVRSVEDASRTGGLPAAMKAISDFDARIGVPGLGAKLIDMHSSKPPASAPKK